MSNSSYSEQNGCHNCYYVFIREEYDNELEYYCTYNAEPRPYCMSMLMEGDIHPIKHEEFAEWVQAWSKWKKNKEVKPWGVCNYYKK